MKAETFDAISYYMKKTGKSEYKAKKLFYPNGKFNYEEVMKWNKEWIEEMKKEGKTIVDIGIDKKRPASKRSDFYKMEQESTKNYGKIKEIKLN